jgi:hypothetical protein
MLTKVGFYIFHLQTGRIKTCVVYGDREVPEAPGDEGMFTVQLKVVTRCIPCPCEQGEALRPLEHKFMYSFCLESRMLYTTYAKTCCQSRRPVAEASLPNSALDLSIHRSTAAAAGTRNIENFVGNTSLRMSECIKVLASPMKWPKSARDRLN